MAHGSEKKVCVLKVDIARCQGIPRGHRPRARTEAPRMGTGRSRVHPRRNSFGDASGSPRTHPEKTRLLEFGPYAIDQRQWRGEGKPETFNFLGFTHICVKKRSNGRFTVLRQTMRKRLQAKLNEVKAELQRRRHEPIPELGQWLEAVVRGHIRYYGVPMNRQALWIFRFQVGRLWHRALSRRSQNGRVLWDRMRRLITRWLPLPIVCHPYLLRFDCYMPRWAASAAAASSLRNEKKAGDCPMNSPMPVRNLSAPVAAPVVFVG